MPYGLISTGFNAKRLADIVDELETAFKTEFGDGVNLQAETPLGQIIGIMAERFTTLWELAEAVYGSINPDSATGQALDTVCNMVGVVRNAATYSTATVTFTGTPTTVIPAGTQVAVSGNETIIFETDTIGTIAGGGTVDIACTCTTTGANSANAGALTVIVTPISGLTSTSNAADAVEGNDLETDAALRERRDNELQQSEGSSLEAIRVAITEIDDVDAAAAFENTTNAVVAGRPAHSFEIVVKGGTAQDIVDEIWDKKPAGIATYGSSSGTAVDSQGDSHTIYFSRPVEVDMHVDITVTQESGYTVLAADVKDAITDYADLLNMGEDVLPVTEVIPAVVAAIEGIRDVVILVEDVDPPTVDTPFTIAASELAVFDQADMDVTIV